MSPINWYQVRHYVKWTLTSVTVLFFLVTIVQLLVVKQFYIKRYVEMHLMDVQTDSPASFDGKHKVFQVDEEIDLAKFNLTESNETLAVQHRAAHQTHDQPSVLDEPEHNGPEEDDRLSSEVKFITGIIVAAIVLIELLYCILYLYIIAQKRFCSMLCFAILSFLSLIFHIQLHLTIHLDEEDEQDGESSTRANSTYAGHHQPGTFFTHIESLDPESLVNHITRSSLTEVILSSFETLLALIYSAILYKFPGRRQSQRLAGFFRLGAARPGVGNGRIPNGHAMAIEMNSIDEPVDVEEEDPVPGANDSDSSSQSSSSLSQDLNLIHQRSPLSEQSETEHLPSSSSTNEPLIDEATRASAVIVPSQ